MSEIATPPQGALGETIGRLKSKLRDTALKLRAAEERATAAETARAAAEAAAARAQSDFNADPLKGEVDRLKGEIRTRDHRAVFDRVAKGKGVAEDALDLVWQTSGYKAEGDAADEAKIGVLLDGLKGKPGVARLFGEAPAPAPTTTPAAGRGQGAPAVDQGARFRVTSAQMRDPEWCRANHARRARALREGNLEIVD